MSRKNIWVTSQYLKPRRPRAVRLQILTSYDSRGRRDAAGHDLTHYVLEQKPQSAYQVSMHNIELKVFSGELAQLEDKATEVQHSGG